MEEIEKIKLINKLISFIYFKRNIEDLSNSSIIAFKEQETKFFNMDKDLNSLSFKVQNSLFYVIGSLLEDNKYLDIIKFECLKVLKNE